MGTAGSTLGSIPVLASSFKCSSSVVSLGSGHHLRRLVSTRISKGSIWQGQVTLKSLGEVLPRKRVTRDLGARKWAMLSRFQRGRFDGEHGRSSMFNGLEP